jgi:hypothetical protein
MICFKLLSVVTQKMKCFNTDTKTEKTKQILNCIEKIAQYHQLALETIPVNYMANIELVKKTFFTPHNNSKTLYIANEEVWRKCYTFEDAWLYVELGDMLSKEVVA